LYAAVKLILPVVIACGSLIAAIIESAHRGLILCICGGFVVGTVAGELVRRQRRDVVRSAPATWSRARLALSQRND